MPVKKITLYQITFPSLKHLVLMLTKMPGTLNRTLASKMPWGSPAGFICKIESWAHTKYIATFAITRLS